MIKEIILDYILEKYEVRYLRKCEKEDEFFFFRFGDPLTEKPLVLLYADEIVFSYFQGNEELIIKYVDPQLVDEIDRILESVKK